MSEKKNEKVNVEESSNTTENMSGVDRRKFLQYAAGSSALTVLGAAAVTTLSSGSANAAPAPVRAGAPLSLYTQPFPVKGYAVRTAGGKLSIFDFRRRAVGPNDVVIDIHYCGVCHSDIHTGHGDWGPMKFPLVTGHELAGVVVALGSGVSEFEVGDHVGVGCMVNSCGVCSDCRAGMEQYCQVGPTMTYGSPVPESVEPTGVTQGGYSTAAVVNKDFVIKIPKDYDLAAAGPVMCAAVTVYSPLRHWQVRKDSKVAIVGMGGLGHLAVKLAKSMGAEVVVFTTSPDKADDARRFGAHGVVVNYDAEKLKKLNRHFDFVLDTVPYQHELDPIMNTMKRDATLCLVGIGKVSEPNQLSPFTTVLRRYSFAGSTIGGIRETQEVIDYCNLHGIKPDYRLIKPSDINQTWSDVVAKKARYRYVMDLKQI